jgi:hypothetical protein
MKSSLLLVINTFVIAFILSGCSGISSPVDTPLQDLSKSSGLPDGVGLFGAYHVSIDTETLTGEIVPLRNASIGESFIVNGMSFFDIFPCGDCIRLGSIMGNANVISLGFFVDHPFPAGNPADPPSGTNRLDLDIFDLAAVFLPNVTLTNFPSIAVDVRTGFIAEPDGYTRELEGLVFYMDALPYVLVVNDASTATSTFNKFSMGDTESFSVAIKPPPSSLLDFNMYLTFGYGASATFQTRLTPKYYNPEFNRKAAWKVKAEPQDNWFSADSTTPVIVRVTVYDWQQNAIVTSDPANYADDTPSKIFEASNVASVQLELPSLINGIIEETTRDSGSGTPTDPLIFDIPVRNQNMAFPFTYTCLVKVIDERAVDSITETRDQLVNSWDGKQIEKYILPEFATYQIFEAVVL